MTREDWKKYGKHHTDTTRCPYCGKLIAKNEEGVTYTKTKGGLHSFVHDKCAGLKGGSDD